MNFLSSRCVVTNSSSWMCVNSSGSVSSENYGIGEGRIGKSEWKGEVLTERLTQTLAVDRAMGKWHLRERDSSAECCYKSDFM